MDFKDYLNRRIELSDASWTHIQEAHPGVSLAEISTALSDPDEVIQCPRQHFVELFYQIKQQLEGKRRFRVVVVKVLSSGNFVSTAMTASSVKNGNLLYKKGDLK